MLENNCWLNQLTGVYENREAAYREDKGDTFVDGPVNDFTTNYANAKSGLDDEKYMEVASAKSRVDLMFFYMKTCHIVDVCTYRKVYNEQNNKTVAEHPVLFMASEAQCSKATQAKDEFETGAGAALLQERDLECASPTTPTPATGPPPPAAQCHTSYALLRDQCARPLAGWVLAWYCCEESGLEATDARCDLREACERVGPITRFPPDGLLGKPPFGDPLGDGLVGCACPE
jgi:hypothetical protein